jgi:hypothetical protein
MKKLILGMLIGIGTQLLCMFVLYSLASLFLVKKAYLDPAPFMLLYPLGLSIIISLGVIYFKKQYVLAGGIFLGLFLLVGILALLLGFGGGV